MESNLDPLRAELGQLLGEYDIPFDDSAELSDDCSVPVNIEQIRSFYRHELNAVEEKETAQLIAHYRSWRTASRKIIAETTEEER